MLPRVIGVNGFAGSGKDTVAQYFIQNHGYRRISMADAVKDVLTVVFGWDRQMLQGDTPESRKWREQPDPYWSEVMGEDFTPRLAMQRTGTELFRNTMHTDIWCHVVRRQILSNNDKWIIPDLRFSNEIDIVQDLDGDMIEVQRGEQPVWYKNASEQNITDYHLGPDNHITVRMEMMYPDLHPSEYKWIGINNPKYILNNNGTLDDLYRQLEELYPKP